MELTHEPIVGVDAATEALNVFLGLCQGHLILLHHVCYHLPNTQHMYSSDALYIVHVDVYVHIHVRSNTWYVYVSMFVNVCT